MNSASIGIELDNNGQEAYDEAQLKTLEGLLQELRVRYRIKSENIVGHSDVSPGRKIDPGPYFPWQRLAASGLGLWCVNPPDALTPIPWSLPVMLVMMGYDPKLPEASRDAFARHYLSDGQGGFSDDAGLVTRTAYCLIQQKAAGLQ